MSSSRTTASVGAVLGALAVLAIPAAVGAAALTSRVTLLRSLYASVPAAFVLGLASVGAYRRARSRLQRSVRRSGRRVVAAARLLAFAGLYVAVTGALALGFYGLLHLRS